MGVVGDASGEKPGRRDITPHPGPLPMGWDRAGGGPGGSSGEGDGMKRRGRS
jgi:hypothetical protein